MAKLTILEYPDPRLRTIAEPVETVDDAVRAQIDDMLETMYDAPGIGLAATQVNIHKRIVTIDISEEQNGKTRVSAIDYTLFSGLRVTPQACFI